MEYNWVWVLIPIAAIITKTLRDVLRIRVSQTVLGKSSRELEQTVDELKRKNQDLAQRLENLETIVVSRTWEAIHQPDLSEGDRQRSVASAIQREVQEPSSEEVNRQRAAQLARRLQG
jgi:hypothetical protein